MCTTPTVSSVSSPRDIRAWERQLARGDVAAVAAASRHAVALLDDAAAAETCAVLREDFHRQCGYRHDKIEGEIAEQQRQRERARLLYTRAAAVFALLVGAACVLKSK